MYTFERTSPDTWTHPPVLDLSTIHQLCRGDQSRIDRILSVFAAELPESEKKMREAFQSRDYETLRKEMHRLSPSMGNLGAVDVQNELLDLEAALDSGEIVFNFTSRVSQVLDQVAHVTRLLKRATII